MLKVALIGCGKIADQHIEHIQRTPGCRIVGVCDREELMARQLAERCGVQAFCSDAAQLLQECRPDVVHVTTPPASHFELGKLCLEAGCHTYIEKPFTIDSEQAAQLIDLAKRRDLKITAGHNLQFTHESRDMRRLVEAGFLGGPPVHMESTYTYSLGDPSYAKALLGDRKHWVRRLPGKLLHNIISHGIARIAEFIDADRPLVIAHGFRSPLLQEIGETEIVDELRVLVHDRKDTTAYFTFSTQLGPPVHQFRIYGPVNSILVDSQHRICIKLDQSGYKSFLNYFLPPFNYGRKYMRSSARNIRKFLAMDFHDDSGMKSLIAAFYQSIERDEAPPIPYRQILQTAEIMDNIFRQLNREPVSEVELSEGEIARTTSV